MMHSLKGESFPIILLHLYIFLFLGCTFLAVDQIRFCLYLLRAEGRINHEWLDQEAGHVFCFSAQDESRTDRSLRFPDI